MDLFRAIAQEQDYKLNDPDATKEFLERLSRDLSAATTNPITLYGISAQNMFEYVAASLGKSQLIKVEDAGAIHTQDDDLKIPDFRIVLVDGSQFLVEAKNFHQKSPFQPFQFKESYKDALLKYANLVGLPLKIAVYWSRWNIWTLVPADSIPCQGRVCALELEFALKNTEMASLGDVSLATTPPLKFRVLTDPNSDRTIQPDGTVEFRVGGLELYCADTKIEVGLEQAIALFLMMYGDWPSELGPAISSGDQLIAFDFVSEPGEAVEAQPFSIVGSMSGMVSRRFLSMTSEDGQIERLAPKSVRSDLGITIPEDYRGTHLPVWRFTLVPTDWKPPPTAEVD